MPHQTTTKTCKIFVKNTSWIPWKNVMFYLIKVNFDTIFLFHVWAPQHPSSLWDRRVDMKLCNFQTKLNSRKKEGKKIGCIVFVVGFTIFHTSIIIHKYENSTVFPRERLNYYGSIRVVRSKSAQWNMKKSNHRFCITIYFGTYHTIKRKNEF